MAVQLSAGVHGGLGCRLPHQERRNSPTIPPRLWATVPHHRHFSGPNLNPPGHSCTHNHSPMHDRRPIALYVTVALTAPLPPGGGTGIGIVLGEKNRFGNLMEIGYDRGVESNSSAGMIQWTEIILLRLRMDWDILGQMVVTLGVTWWGWVYIYGIVQGKHHVVGPKDDPL